ncbi:neugrin [Paroedura picta]|uniref:neugrin n=1 Tax=Paroedura picta TaxID=143630 RepID=UPI004057A0D5
MAARWGRLRGAIVRPLAKELESEEEAAARLEQERRAKAIRLRRIQRIMEPPGPPERQLTRSAMDQMRYLRQNSPEEWSICRLARSFDVSPDVVARVLRSRFSPPLERALKQDSRLQPQRSGGVSAPGPPGQLLLLPTHAGNGALVPDVKARKRAGRGAPPPADRSPQGHGAEPTNPNQEPCLQVLQQGQTFLDADGNFLYRIPA